MTRKEIIEQLKEIGNITLNSKELEDVMPEVYDYFLHVFRFMEEELKDFQEGKYLVAIGFGEKEVTYTVGRDAQQLANEPVWVYDKYADIETETLAALLEAAQQG